MKPLSFFQKVKNKLCWFSHVVKTSGIAMSDVGLYTHYKTPMQKFAYLTRWLETLASLSYSTHLVYRDVNNVDKRAAAVGARDALQLLRFVKEGSKRMALLKTAKGLLGEVPGCYQRKELEKRIENFENNLDFGEVEMDWGEEDKDVKQEEDRLCALQSLSKLLRADGRATAVPLLPEHKDEILRMYPHNDIQRKPTEEKYVPIKYEPNQGKKGLFRSRHFNVNQDQHPRLKTIMYAPFWRDRNGRQDSTEDFHCIPPAQLKSLQILYRWCMKTEHLPGVKPGKEDEFCPELEELLATLAEKFAQKGEP